MSPAWIVAALLLVPTAAVADEIADELHDCQARELALRDVVTAIDDAGNADAEIALETERIRVRLGPMSAHCGLVKDAAKRLAMLEIQLGVCGIDDCELLSEEISLRRAAVDTSLTLYRIDREHALAAAARIDHLLRLARAALADAALEPACDDGDHEACIELGDTRDDPAWYRAALRHLGRDCWQGESSACERLAEVYEIGDLEVLPSEKKARYFRQRAASTGRRTAR